MNDPLHVVCPNCDSTNRVPSSRLRDDPKCGRCKERLFGRSPVDLTQANFNKHVGSNDIPVVVDFWAPWCGPCKMMAPAFKEAAAQLEPRARLAKVNTENDQVLASQYGIRSIPTLVVFKNGNEVSRQTGALDLNRLLAWVRSQT
jgi:thioredoxin 2